MKWSLGKKLGIVFALILILMVASAVVTYNKIARMRESETSILQLRVPVIFHTLRATAKIAQQASKLREYILIADDPELAGRTKKDWEQFTANLNDEVEKLQELSVHFAHAENRELVAGIRKQLDEANGLTQVCLRMRDAHQPDSMMAAARYMSSEVTPRTAQLRANIDKVADAAAKTLQTEETNLAEASTSAYRMLFVTTFLAMALGCIAAVLLSRRIVSAVSCLLQRARAIAAGELTGKELEALSQDEIGDLTIAMNEMQASLRHLLGSIEHSAESVAGASEQMSSAATQAAEGSRRQSDQATQVATAIQEMAATVAAVSENSHRAAEGARNAADTAKQGGKIVDQALDSMRSIAQAVGATATRIEKLGKNSDQIGKIVAVIDDIAGQTNLLALNAAIEAARAGEQGRGFAVVADEVRKLAERTTKATHEISQMIETVQQETRTAVDNMQVGTKQVDLGVEITTRAGKSLTEIIEAAQKVGDMVAQIATAATQQSSATEQIKDSVESIVKITQESAAGAQQSASTGQNLSGLALDLQQLVNRFQLDRDPGARAGVVRPRKAPSSLPPGARPERKTGYPAQAENRSQSDWESASRV